MAERKRRLKYTKLLIVEWLEKNEVRLFFSSRKVVEMKLPWVKSAEKVCVVDQGMGLGLGDGRDVSALMLAERRGRVLRAGRPGFVGSSSKPSP